jgi:hypothetical protein
MAAPLPEPRARNGEWIFVHVLAGLTIAEVLLLIVLNVVFSVVGQPPSIPFAVGALGAVGAIALLWFWVRMLVDFFRERPVTHRVAWGWALTLGCYLGAIAYFFLIWRPRHRAVAA